MITVKNIYNTHAYQEMKVFCKGDKAKLKELALKYVDNWNEQRVGDKVCNNNSLMDSFVWSESNEGTLFWQAMYHGI